MRAEKRRAQTSGVRVSPRPRKMPFDTSHIVAVGIPSDRTRRYEIAIGRIGLPAVAPIAPTIDGAERRKKQVCKMPTVKARTSAARIACSRAAAPSLPVLAAPSPDATIEMEVLKRGSLNSLAVA